MGACVDRSIVDTDSFGKWQLDISQKVTLYLMVRSISVADLFSLTGTTFLADTHTLISKNLLKTKKKN